MPAAGPRQRSTAPVAGSCRPLHRRYGAALRSTADSDSIWLLTLSDLLTLLLVFFVFFLAVRTADTHRETRREAAGVAIESKGLQLFNLPADDRSRSGLASAIKELDGRDGISVRTVQGEVIITLKERVTFRPGEAEVLPSSEPVLRTISDIIKGMPSFAVEIDGHTDNVPISTRLYPSNWELSVARATAVLKHFINRQGIDPSRLSVKGNADLRPLVPHDTPEHRAENRRVEIRLRETKAN
jgi:chemotaxis protein MotB